MRSDGRRQPDLIRHSPPELAKAHRAAAAAARNSPYETTEQCEARARYHEAEAEALERLTTQPTRRSTWHAA